MATPKKTKPLQVWEKVDCRYCGARKGKRCTTKSGLVAPASHTARFKEVRAQTRQKELAK